MTMTPESIKDAQFAADEVKRQHAALMALIDTVAPQIRSQSAELRIALNIARQHGVELARPNGFLAAVESSEPAQALLNLKFRLQLEYRVNLTPPTAEEMEASLKAIGLHSTVPAAG